MRTKHISQPGGISGLARRTWAFLLFAAILGGSLAAAVYFSPRRPAQSMEGHVHSTPGTAEDRAAVYLDSTQYRKIGILFVPVTAGVLRSEVRAVGSVTVAEPRLAVVAPKLEGWIDSLFVNSTWEFVRKGQPLFTIYSPMLVAAQEEYLLAYRLATQLEGTTSEAGARAATLAAAARRRLELLDLPDTEIEALERRGTASRALPVLAPSDGYVAERRIAIGQKIMPGETAYLLADLSLLWVEGEIYEQDLPLLRTGAAVNAEFAAYPGERFSGQLDYIYPQVDPTTRTTKVRVEVSNRGLRLRPGMYATLHIAVPERRGLVVPRSAVLETGRRALVFRKERDGSLQPQLVITGASSGEWTEIVSGLALGDTVVASATFLIDAESNLRAALQSMQRMPGMQQDLPKGTAPNAGQQAVPHKHDHQE
jgi:Cu(I)/Ag(I) efflux system membrane fusion protein